MTRRTAISIARVAKVLSCRYSESMKRISAVRQWNLPVDRFTAGAGPCLPLRTLSPDPL